MARWLGGVVFGSSILLALGWFLVLKPWSGNAEPPPAGRSKPDQFAEERAPLLFPVIPYDANRAMGYLETVCKIGPRISGSEGMKKQQELLKKHFEDRGGKVSLQRFPAKQVSFREPIEMANLIVSWFPDRNRRVLLCTHYDTRPIADQETERNKWREPFLSANDGGSGVAFLMEFANHMKDLKTGVGVDFVCFDGEETIFDPKRDRYFFGSEYFAREYRKTRSAQRYAAGVLLDMIAGQNPKFPYEQHSVFKAGALVNDLWAIAQEQHCPAFRAEMSATAVLDDHLALNDAGIPTVDIIDFSYPHWHRLSDLPANCSGDGLLQVARVLSVWLSRLR